MAKEVKVAEYPGPQGTQLGKKGEKKGRGGCIPSWKEAEAGLESPGRNREHIAPLGKEERPCTPLHCQGGRESSGVFGRRWELCVGQVPETCVWLCYRRAQAPTSLQYAKRQGWTASGEAESESAGRKQGKWSLQGLRGL